MKLVTMKALTGSDDIDGIDKSIGSKVKFSHCWSKKL